MGQYYHPCILKEDWRREKQPVDFSTYAHAYGSGLKLTETCYTGVRYIDYITHMLATKYKGRPFVFCGDYADGITTEAFPDVALRFIHPMLVKNATPEQLLTYVKTEARLKEVLLSRKGSYRSYDEERNKIVTDRNTAEELLRELSPCEDLSYSMEGTCNLYNLAWEWIEENNMKKFNKSTRFRYKYIINLDKKQYVAIPPNKKHEWCINPLTILCSLGNGRGGGNYRNDSPYVGAWAFDRIAVTKDKEETVGCNEIKPDFKIE